MTTTRFTTASAGHLAGCLLIGLMTLLPGPGAEAATRAAMLAALDHPERSEADRTRDASSRPGDVMALADLQAGETVLDLFGGAGYYSEIAARIVGPGGRVYLHNNAAYAGFVGPALEARLLDGRLPNVVRLDMEIPDFSLPPASLDLILMVMSWHDLYWESDDWPAVDVAAFVPRLRQALAPGGRLVIVDHAAPPGAGADSVDALHRIEEAHVIATLEAAGFALTGRSEALRNPVDDRTINVFDPQIRRRTDRFVLRFEVRN